MNPLSLVLAAVRITLGALFVYAALTKVGDFHLFAEEIANYQLLPAALVPVVAAALPGIEIAAGALLVAGLWWRPAAILIGVMLAVFTVGLAQALVRGIDLTCGCFGGSDPATWGTVVRDVVMLAGIGLVLWKGPGAAAMQPAD